MTIVQAVGLTLILISLFALWIGTIEFIAELVNCHFNGGWSTTVRLACILITGLACYYFGGNP